MATTFPTSLDSLVNPTSWTPRNQTGQVETEIIANANDSIEAIEAYLWVTTETDESTITGKIKKLDILTTKGDLLTRTSSWYTRLPVWTDGYQIVADSAEVSWLKFIPVTSWGTVTTIAVDTANGFAWTIANPTTTPTITLTTSATWLLKGSSGQMVAATAGTDYYAPTWTDVLVADGGTGRSSHTAYALIAWGTTSTWPQQSLVWVGTSWQVLTSNGASTLPTFQSLSQWTLLKSVADTTYSNTTSYNVLATTTVPWGYLNGNWVKVEWTFIVRSQGLADARDDFVFKMTYGGTNIATFTIRPAPLVDSIIKVEWMLEWTGGSTQDTSLACVGSYNAVSNLTAWTVDSSIDQTLTLECAMWFAFATCYIKHRNTLIQKI